MFYALFLLVTFIILAFVLYHWQFYMLFRPTYYKNRKLHEDCRLLEINREKNIVLEGVIYEPKDSKATLLLFVGRSHDAVALIDKLRSCYPHYRVMAFNYRGYGESQGVIDEKNMLQDALEIAALVEKNYGSFYLLGFSLGSNVAAYVASKREVKALFLIGAFDSLASLIRMRVKGSILEHINLSIFLRYRLDTAQYTQKVTAPTYLFASSSDSVTPLESAKLLKKSIYNLCHYSELDNVTHQELLWVPEVREKISALVDSLSKQ